MTEDDIFRLARQADGILVRSGFFPAHCVMLNDQLIRFAALVAAVEREAIIDIIEEYRISLPVLGELKADIRARSEK